MKSRKGLILLVACVAAAMINSCSSQKNDAFSYNQAKALEEAGWQQVPEILARIIPPTFREQTFNVTQFGAKGDSTTDNREAINNTIKACSERGGGQVLIPAGQYFVDGPIILLSNVNLHIAQNARLYFSSNPDSYLPAVKVRWEGTMCYNYSPLIYGFQLENVALTGKGTIDGAAREWSREWRKVQKPDKNRLRQMGNDKIPDDQRVFGNGYLDLDGDGKDDGFGDGQQHFLRPSLIELIECKNILFEDLTITESPFWTVHPVFCKNVTIRNLKVFGVVLNDDGVDPDSSEDVLIEGCEIQTRDDAISIKAGRDQDAWDRPGSKNIIVRNNRLLSGANALCIGSEMSGGVENIFAEDNYIANGMHALNFKCNLDRGGQVQRVFLRNTKVESCRDAMFIFRMDYHGYRGNNFPTKFNDFFVSNITCGNVEKKPFKIVGVEAEPITRVMLDNIKIEKAGEESAIEFADQLVLNKVMIEGNELTVQ
ncbi:MAG: glycoside hydrolase family 28 protein [Cyclobacteriaceae bacterium]|nr:glycoside hydrolase family 28 protein [Cyclobacteriaceae bacterium HetDA_MAG_MS6]